jgi:hypothetical protein
MHIPGLPQYGCRPCDGGPMMAQRIMCDYWVSLRIPSPMTSLQCSDLNDSVQRLVAQGPVPHMVFRPGACSAHGISGRTWGCARRVRPWGVPCAHRPHMVSPMSARENVCAHRSLMGAHLPFVCAHENREHERNACGDESFGVRDVLRCTKIVCTNEKRVHEPNMPFGLNGF